MANTKTTRQPNATSKSKSTVSKPKVYTEAELQEAISKAVSEAIRGKNNLSSQEDMIEIMFIGGIAKGTTVSLGGMGKIVKDCGTITIPKREFLNSMTAGIEKMLASRKLVVLSGMSEEERERYGVLYHDNDILTEQQFYKLLDYDVAEICSIFEKLCDTHKRIVSKVFYSAFAEGDKRINPEKIKALNAISEKTTSPGLFSAMLDDMRATKMI